MMHNEPTLPVPALVAERAASTAPSARPTSVPEGYLEGLALSATTGLSLADMIPIQLAEAPSSLEHRTAFVLAHVDERSTIRQIAEYTQLPLSEVLGAVLTLAERGVLALGITQGSEAPVSGVVPAITVIPTALTA